MHYRAKTLAQLANAFKLYVENELQGAENCLAQKEPEQPEDPEAIGKDIEFPEGPEVGMEDEDDDEINFFQTVAEFFQGQLSETFENAKKDGKLTEEAAKTLKQQCEKIDSWIDKAKNALPFFNYE